MYTSRIIPCSIIHDTSNDNVMIQAWTIGGITHKATQGSTLVQSQAICLEAYPPTPAELIDSLRTPHPQPSTGEGWHTHSYTCHVSTRGCLVDIEH